MKSLVVMMLALVVAWTGWDCERTYAQRGTGGSAGVARQPVRPESVEFPGKLVAIEVEPCPRTTGRASIGTHLQVEVENGQLRNVHLGPQTEVAFAVKQLTVGKDITVRGFRTSEHAEGDYVAQVITADGNRIELRDESLRPVWAGAGATPATRSRDAVGRGRRGSMQAGTGRGYRGGGRGYGRRGGGRGNGQGYGAGGWGYGRGRW